MLWKIWREGEREYDAAEEQVNGKKAIISYEMGSTKRISSYKVAK